MKKSFIFSLFLSFTLLLLGCSSKNNAPSANTPPNTSFKNCRIFYYDCDKDNYFYIDKTLEVTDNALLTSLTTALKSADSNTLTTLDQDVEVKSGKLDAEHNLLSVDLSPDYYNILRRVGSSSESGLLHSLAYTYGYNYGVNQVIITINGKPYNGSHILLEEGESIPVITDNIKAFDY